MSRALSKGYAGAGGAYTGRPVYRYIGVPVTVLGCIVDADFLSLKTNFAAFFNLYEIGTPLHRSKLQLVTNF